MQFTEEKREDRGSDITLWSISDILDLSNSFKFSEVELCYGRMAAYEGRSVSYMSLVQGTGISKLIWGEIVPSLSHV